MKCAINTTLYLSVSLSLSWFVLHRVPICGGHLCFSRPDAQGHLGRWKYQLGNLDFGLQRNSTSDPVTDLLKRPSSDHLLMQTLSIFTLLYLTYSWLYLTKNVGMGHSTPRSPTLNIMKESESQYQCVYILSTFTPTHFGHMLWDVVAIPTGGPSRV